MPSPPGCKSSSTDMPFENVIANSALLAGVDQGTMRSMAGSLAEERWSRGRQILGPGDSAESFRLVIEGRIKIVRSNSHDGRELTLWLLGPGDGFDIVSLLDGQPHAVTAWAIDEARTLAAPMALWRGWLEESRLLQLAAHRYVAAKLREVSDLAGDLALHDTSTRLANLLLRHFASKEGNLLRDLPQRELASMIGSVRIVVSRLLARMGRQGVVELRGGAVRAIDLKRLLAKAQSELAHGNKPAREVSVRRS
jgi:CRP/FNR family transcriptional regulator, cyclic AMP receptor protein